MKNHPQAARAQLIAFRGRTALASTTGLLALLFAVMAGFVNRPPRREERGDVIVQHLGVILLAIVLLVGLFALLTTFGNDIITQIRSLLGLSSS